ncbi:UNVERIFIED_CONTAM: hypothetical protein Slati_3216700 [Sesamum latifolium]|uniref:Uncharacterized protein n=1 Tax=Sesamum latifolium TaxID=2727402 RepID=A0AAW2UZ28_9LAMI
MRVEIHKQSRGPALEELRRQENKTEALQTKRTKGDSEEIGEEMRRTVASVAVDVESHLKRLKSYKQHLI